jgi:hypothetical protein
MSDCISESYGKIPYQFCAIPYEFFRKEFIEDPPMMTLIFFIFKRIRFTPHPIKIKSNGWHEVSLQPFEFIFGRHACSQETGLTERQIRTRLERLVALGYLTRQTTSSSTSSSTSSCSQLSTSSFSVYRLSTESFGKKNVQQFKGVNDQQFDQQFDHKQDVLENQDISVFKKETNKEKDVHKFDTPLPPKGGVVVPLSLSNKEKKIEQASHEDILAVEVVLNEHLGVMNADPKTIRIWIEKFSLERVVDSILLLKRKPSSVENKMGWLNNCLKNSWDVKDKNKSTNREFFIKFKNENDLYSLKIYGTMAKDKSNDFEFDFTRNPADLQDYAKRKYGF